MFQTKLRKWVLESAYLNKGITVTKLPRDLVSFSKAGIYFLELFIRSNKIICVKGIVQCHTHSKALIVKKDKK